MKQRVLVACAVTALIVAIIWQIWVPSASPHTASDCHSDLTPQTVVTSVYIQPDDGYAPVLDEINQARCSIDLSMYLLSDSVILDALAQAAQRGITVRVILERSPFNTYGGQVDTFDRLVASRIEVIWSADTFTYSHAKYMVIDGQVAIISNQNFTGAGFNSNREFGVVSTDPSYVEQAAAIFEADWLRQTDVQGITSLIVSPVNARSRILELINGSRSSIWMYAEVLRDEQFTQALDRAAARGVDVRLIVNPSVDDDNAPYFLDAMAHGVQVRVQKRPYVHAKLIIVDGDRALVGSQNYSSTSLDQNREIGLIITDPDALIRMSEVYSRDWQRAEPVDSVAIVVDIRLTRMPWFGSISSGRWGVV